jgi:ferredoxin-NADP reductase
MHTPTTLLPFGTGPTVSRVRTFETPPTEEEKQWNGIATQVGGCIVVLIVALVFYFDLDGKTYRCLFPSTVVFDSPKFTPFSIVSKEDVSPTSFIVTLRPKSFVDNSKPENSDPYEKEREKGIWSVEFKQPELQIARSYTPLPPRENDTRGDLRFLIRREASGEMSRYIAQLPVETQVELRGPHTELELPREVTDVVFLAGGTGIAPALQVVHTLLKVRKGSEILPNIRILWANRRREDCVGGMDLRGAAVTDRTEGPIVQELRKLHEIYPDKVKVDYLVDEEGTLLNQGLISKLTRTESELKHQATTTRNGSKLLIVSGPEGFVSFLAGPKKYWGGKEVQGDVGGLIGKMGIKDWTVWKQ